VTGDAVVFANYGYIPVPDDLDPGLALVAVDISCMLSQVARYVNPPDTAVVCIIGCGKVGLTALCYLRKLAPKAKILCVDVSDAKLEIASSLNKADVVAKVNAQHSMDLLGFVRKHTDNVGADLVLNCATMPDLEISSMLSVRQGGTVIFCSTEQTQLGTIRNCPTDVCVVVAGGFRRALAEMIFDLLRTDPQLHTIINAFCKLKTQ